MSYCSLYKLYIFSKIITKSIYFDTIQAVVPMGTHKGNKTKKKKDKFTV